MIKFFRAALLPLVAGLLFSLSFVSLSFASIATTTLFCGGLQSDDGQPVVGVGYSVYIINQINNRTPGSPPTSNPAFRLISSVISPAAKLNSQPLVLDLVDARGNYHLSGVIAKVIVSHDFSKALLRINNASALCN